MSDAKTMNKALVDIFNLALEWETDLPIMDQILKLAEDAIPTTAQIMVAFSKEQALQARTERLERAYEAYCKLLIEELKEVMPLAISHGWKSSRFDQGEKLRAEIKAALEEGKL